MRRSWAFAGVGTGATRGISHQPLRHSAQGRLRTAVRKTLNHGGHGGTRREVLGTQ